MMFASGLAIGYVLGSKAGRERYDQIVAAARKFWESPTVQEAAGVVQEQANKLYTQGKDAVGSAVSGAVHRNGRDARTPSATALTADADEEEAWDAHVRRAQFPSSAF
jgi:hypothetical protein